MATTSNADAPSVRGLAAFAWRPGLRSRWPAIAAIALLLGTTTGLAGLTIAGARRTQSSYSRFLDSAVASTISVTTFGNFDQATNDRIAGFAEVRQSRTYVGLQVFVLVDGQPDYSQVFEASGTFDGEYFDQDRFHATEGRAPDRTRTDEVAVNRFAAEQNGYRVGQRLDLGTYDLGATPDPTSGSSPAPGAPQDVSTVTIVGIGLFPDEVVQDDSDRTARFLLTPAFTEHVRKFATYGLQGLVLNGGDADVDSIREQVAEITPPGTVEFRVTSVDEQRAERAIRPLTIALAAFGLITGIAGLMLTAQSIWNLLNRERRERAVLRSLGASQRATTVASALAPCIAVALGTAIAFVIAVAGSPLMPIGPVRAVEVDRGVDVDWTVLGVGAVSIIVVMSLVTIAMAWRQRPHRSVVAPRHLPLGRRVISRASFGGLSPSTSAGIRFALEPSDGQTASRSVLAGVAIAVVALVTSVTFGASLHTLVSEPRLFGWNWDAAVNAGQGYGNLDPDVARTILAADDHIDAWSGAYFGTETVDGHEIPMLGMAPDSVVDVPIIEGRSIRSASEAVLGGATARLLDKRVGDIVTLPGEGVAHDVTIVGIATLPAIGVVHATRTTLGTGILVVPELVPGFDRDITGVKGVGLGPTAIFIRYRPGTDAATELAHLRETTQPLAGFAGIDVLGVQRPAEIVNSSSVGNAPIVLSGVLAFAAVVSLAVSLTTSIRRRRRDLLLHRALGLTPRQLAATVSWQATITVAVGLVVGVPLGSILGRLAWQMFARRVDVVVEPTVPVITLVGIIVAALVVANLVAVVPARNARRIGATDPARQ